MREDVAAALAAHFAAGRPSGARLFRTELDRRDLYETNLTQIAYDRQLELRDRWRAAAAETGRDPDDAEMEDDTRTMLWIDAFLAALALVDQGVLP